MLVGYRPPVQAALYGLADITAHFFNTGLFIHLIRIRYLDELRQRQQAEQSARKSEARFRQLYITAQRQTKS